MENPPFEDVFPIQDGDFPLLCLFTGGYGNTFSMRHFFLYVKALVLNNQNFWPET